MSTDGKASDDPRLRHVSRIAVLRANAVGDFLFALPALEALRAHFPRAEFVLLGKRWHRDFLDGRPSPVDRVEVVPYSTGVNVEVDSVEDPAEVDGFFHRMKSAAPFDLAIQMHGGGRYSNPFLLRLAAGVTAGLKAPLAAPLDYWIPYVYFQPEILRYLEVASLLGARPVTVEPRVRVLESDVEEFRRLVPDGAKPLVVLNPGAGDGRRRWPAERFARVADRLTEEGYGVVVQAAHFEAGLARAVALSMARTPLAVCLNLSLGGLAGMLSQASLLISNDSGPLHLAAAVGTPTVGIYWCGNMVTAGLPTRAWHRPVISWRVHCPACGAHCVTESCRHDASFVADIEVATVLEAAAELLPCRP